MQKKVNLEYMNLAKELIFFWLLPFVIIRKKKGIRDINNSVLIVCPCLIGEFMATVPALRDFIRRNIDKRVDIVVTPPLRAIAERIIGIGNIYCVSSVYSRNDEDFNDADHIPRVYDHIHILRLSSSVFHILRHITFSHMSRNTLRFTAYVLHLWKSLLFRRTPKQWRDFNSELLGGETNHISFDEIFSLKDIDYNAIEKFNIENISGTRVMIHTGSNWPMKKWDNEKWRELIERINSRIPSTFIFIGSNQDLDDYEYITSRIPRVSIHSLIGKTNLLETMLLMRKCQYFIGIDSGPANMAHLSELSSLTIFGPGPHMYLPNNPNDVFIDKSRGRGLYQMFFRSRNSFIEKITVDEAYEKVCHLMHIN